MRNTKYAMRNTWGIALMQDALLATKAITELEEEDVLALSEFKGEPRWMTERRLEAWRVFRDTSKPTTREEPWRRTDIRRLKLNEVAPAAGGARLDNGSTELDSTELVAGCRGLAKVPPSWSSEMIDTGGQAGLLLHADGGLVHAALNKELAEKGVVLTDMDTAVREHGDLLQQSFMNEAVPVTAGYFAAMHGALWSGGTFLYVPRNVRVELPLRVATWAGQGVNSFTHTLIIVEVGGQVTFIEEFKSGDSRNRVFSKKPGFSMHNGVVELILRDNAQLDYVNVQDWDRKAYNFTTERAIVGRDATLHWVIGGVGSRLTKSFVDASLAGPGATALMSGVFFGDGRQHLDYDTQQNHIAPHTTSDLLYKGALKDRARSVWQGMIKVFPGAQKTDGYQANRNLILAKTARADSIPGLEIEADDVRCTHGATVSQLNPDEVFYARSRGLPPEQARRLIVQGFFAPVIERIPLESVRQRLTDEIAKKIG
jgi:Fe-S cluster assembly protein SufD